MGKTGMEKLPALMFTICKHSQSIRFNMTFYIKDKAGQKEDEEMWEKSSCTPQELDPLRGFCVWPFRAVLSCKPWPLDHRLSGGDILQCNSGRPLGTSFVPYKVSCSREMHPRSPFPCLGSDTQHIRGWAMR